MPAHEQFVVHIVCDASDEVQVRERIVPLFQEASLRVAGIETILVIHPAEGGSCASILMMATWQASSSRPASRFYSLIRPLSPGSAGTADFPAAGGHGQCSVVHGLFAGDRGAADDSRPTGKKRPCRPALSLQGRGCSLFAGLNYCIKRRN